MFESRPRPLPLLKPPGSTHRLYKRKKNTKTESKCIDGLEHLQGSRLTLFIFKKIAFQPPKYAVLCWCIIA